MREIRLSGSEGGVALTPPSLPLSNGMGPDLAGFGVPPKGGGGQNEQAQREGRVAGPNNFLEFGAGDRLTSRGRHRGGS
jgi:hypothetical protein